jgi:hypothetical protein
MSLNSSVCNLQYFPVPVLHPPISWSTESYHDAAKDAEADRATQQQGAREKSEHEAAQKLEEQELIVFRKVHVQAEHNYEETPTLAGDEEATTPTSSAFAIPNPPNEVHERTEPQKLVNDPRTVSGYDKPFSKPAYTYWYCHTCGDGPKLWENHVACTRCHHVRCDYCSILYSK